MGESDNRLLWDRLSKRQLIAHSLRIRGTEGFSNNRLATEVTLLDKSTSGPVLRTFPRCSSRHWWLFDLRVLFQKVDCLTGKILQQAFQELTFPCSEMTTQQSSCTWEIPRKRITWMHHNTVSLQLQRTRLLFKTDFTTHQGPADTFQGDPAAEQRNSSLS